MPPAAVAVFWAYGMVVVARKGVTEISARKSEAASGRLSIEVAAGHSDNKRRAV